MSLRFGQVSHTVDRGKWTGFDIVVSDICLITYKTSVEPLYDKLCDLNDKPISSVRTYPDDS